MEGHRVVEAGLDVARAVRSRAVEVGNAELQGLNGALEVCAHRHHEDAVEVGGSRSNADLRARADHEGTDVERAAGAVGRNPLGIGADDFVDRL